MNFLRTFLDRLLFLLPRVILTGIFMFAMVVTVLSNFDLFEPYIAPLGLFRSTIRHVNDRIIIGPYPHAPEMALLKREGVTVIVSLLDASLPQEQALAEREAVLAKKAGIEVRRFSMGYLPVRSRRNEMTREEIARSVAGVKGKIYLHCYLGRHRVAFVAERLAQETGAAGGAPAAAPRKR